MALQSLYIEWMPSSSASDKDVECPTKRYVVRLRDAASSRARSLRFDPSESSAVVSGLPAGSVQRVRLVADSACRQRRSKASRWVNVRLPAAAVSTPGRITKSVRDLQSRETAFQRQTFAVAPCFIFCHISV